MAVLSWNEIKDRALKFTKEWEGEERERAEKDSFWNDFFNVFGISRRRVATFEEPVKKLSGNQGFIDLFWKGTLLVEHKSAGKNLDKAHTQAQDYFPGIKDTNNKNKKEVEDNAQKYWMPEQLFQTVALQICTIP